MMTLRFLVATILLAVFVICGCSGKGYEIYPVSGTVKYADGSVPTGETTRVVFLPVKSGPGSKSAMGEINPSDGKFFITSIELNDGAFPGEYKVVFHIHKTYMGKESLIPEKFTKPETTPFTVQVGPKEKNYHEFVIEKSP